MKIQFNFLCIDIIDKHQKFQYLSGNIFQSFVFVENILLHTRPTLSDWLFTGSGAVGLSCVTDTLHTKYVEEGNQ